jgi:uncharacterized membrane protein
MAVSETTRRAIGKRRYDWLADESRLWVSRGLMSPIQAGEVLEQYDRTGGFGAARARFELTQLAVLMAGVALTLVIGYNWNDLARGAKLTLILGAVVAAFAGSTAAYARSRPRLGEALACAGTLVYGSAIWLLAQVYHISAHYPDGFFWWMTGALVAAHLVRSKAIGLGAALLTFAWIATEALDFGRPDYRYLPAAAATIWLAYRLRSSMLVTLTALASAGWLALDLAVPIGAGLATLGPVLALGASFYAVGLLGARQDDLPRAWRLSGLLIVVVALVPLMTVEVHESAGLAVWARNGTLTLAAILAVATAAVVAERGLGGREWPVLLAPGAAIAWLTGLVSVGPFAKPAAIAFTVVFSAVALGFAAWLMRDGTRTADRRQFQTGAMFGLVFMLCRWLSVVGNLLWSALILAVASALLLWTAWYWRRRVQVEGGL